MAIISPVPHAKSSTFCGFSGIGAIHRFLSRRMKYFACAISILSISCSSIGAPYSSKHVSDSLLLSWRSHDVANPLCHTMHTSFHFPRLLARCWKTEMLTSCLLLCRLPEKSQREAAMRKHMSGSHLITEIIIVSLDDISRRLDRLRILCGTHCASILKYRE